MSIRKNIFYKKTIINVKKHAVSPPKSNAFTSIVKNIMYLCITNNWVMVDAKNIVGFFRYRHRKRGKRSNNVK